MAETESPIPPPRPERRSPATARPAAGPGWIGHLIRFCLERRLVVLLGVLAVVAAGVLVAPFDWNLGGLARYPVATDAIPDIGENQQIVFTEWMGRSPKDVDDQITYPLTTFLMGVPGFKTIRSYSFFGFSSIYVVFDEHQGFYDSRSRLLEKLASLPAGYLPEGVKPALGPDATALGQVYWYTLEGRDPDGRPAGGWDLQELRSVQDWTVRYGLLAAEGVSEVASVGGYVQEYQVDVDPDAMRAARVSLEDVYRAVQMSNVDVGARTIEVNKVEYLIRGRGFLKNVGDLEQAVVRASEGVAIRIKDIAHVARGPALREGALDKGGAEAVGGVVVVRFGYNPLAAIKNVKQKIADLGPALPAKPVVDWSKVMRPEVEAFAAAHGFEAFEGPDLRRDAWMKHLRGAPRAEWPAWVTTSQVTVVPFYDRTGLIYETLGTLNAAILEEILITCIVVIVMLVHLRSSLLISGLLPLAVLMCFIAMKVFGVDANIVALSGIAIAIGTMVDMGIIICENILRHLEEAPPEESRLEVVYRASSEVGGAVLTAISTTVVSFLPVFTMTGPEGKLFRPLAFTKTFALMASVIVALMVIPAGALTLFPMRLSSRGLKRGLAGAGIVAALFLAIALGWWRAGLVLGLLGAYYLVEDWLPRGLRRIGPWVVNGAAVAFLGVIMTDHWLPLGPERGFGRNLAFVAVLLGGMLLFYYFIQVSYKWILRWCLAHKFLFLSLPVLILAGGLYVWIGPGGVIGVMQWIGERPWAMALYLAAPAAILVAGVYFWVRGGLRWAARVVLIVLIPGALAALAAVVWTGTVTARLPAALEAYKGAAYPAAPERRAATYVKWVLANDWVGRGKEFMPPLDEGSYLYMPSLMPHASIGEALDVIALQDAAIRAIPEVESVVGKLGRAETALDPAPTGMFETVIIYKSEYITDKDGRRLTFRWDEAAGDFVHDARGELVPDPDGHPFRQWRPEIRSPDDIWREIVKAGAVTGATSAPKLQPIATRLIMLQTGMRAPMGLKVYGPDLESIERVGIQIERLLKEVPSVEPSAVVADRIVGKPYLEIDINREAAARYGLAIRQIQDVIETAIGGEMITRTVEGRERYPVRVRYPRERRDRIETLGRVLVPAMDGAQIPLEQLADIRYVRGPESIKSEDTFLVGYVLFDKRPGHAEVDVVEECRRRLESKIASGDLVLPAGVHYKFAGNYENEIHASQTLAVVLPLALFLIFMILYFQFKSVPTTLLVFSAIPVAWAGAFLFIWLYGQPWFLDFDVFGVSMRELFQVHPIHLSVAVWVGFIALFGIASDDGVVMATYLDQSFARRRPRSIEEVREATVAAGHRRVRPCLMTTATTVLALLPVLTSTGRGADVMVPMAIPSFGGMLIVVITMYVVPVTYCAVRELHLRTALRREAQPAP